MKEPSSLSEIVFEEDAKELGYDLIRTAVKINANGNTYSVPEWRKRGKPTDIGIYGLTAGENVSEFGRAAIPPHMVSELLHQINTENKSETLTWPLYLGFHLEGDPMREYLQKLPSSYQGVISKERPKHFMIIPRWCAAVMIFLEAIKIGGKVAEDQTFILSERFDDPKEGRTWSRVTTSVSGLKDNWTHPEIIGKMTFKSEDEAKEVKPWSFAEPILGHAMGFSQGQLRVGGKPFSYGFAGRNVCLQEMELIIPDVFRQGFVEEVPVPKAPSPARPVRAGLGSGKRKAPVSKALTDRIASFVEEYLQKKMTKGSRLQTLVGRFVEEYTKSTDPFKGGLYLNVDANRIGERTSAFYGKTGTITVSGEEGDFQLNLMIPTKVLSAKFPKEDLDTVGELVIDRIRESMKEGVDGVGGGAGEPEVTEEPEAAAEFVQRQPSRARGKGKGEAVSEMRTASIPQSKVVARRYSNKSCISQLNFQD